MPSWPGLSRPPTSIRSKNTGGCQPRQARPRRPRRMANRSRRSREEDTGRSHANDPRMTTRIDARFAALRAAAPRRAGDVRHGGRSRTPRPRWRFVRALPAAGADIIELGMPFTDPMADGPAIQAAGLRALQGRPDACSKTLAHGEASSAPRTRHAAHADGLLQSDLYLWRRALPDRRESGRGRRADRRRLPPEEDDELCLPALKAGLAFVRLATPTTDDERLPAVLANTSGFVYFVSITGVTGAAAPDVQASATPWRA